MQDRYKVSIVIPVYNAEEYLERCLDSIVNQTYKNVEVIVIDDGSSDNSRKILTDYNKKYPNLIFPVFQENMGVSKTRNKGIKLATGDYLMLIDNDDYIDVDYISKFVSAANENDYDVVIGGYKRPNSSGKIIDDVVLDAQTEYSKYKIVAAWAKIYKLDYIKRNNIEFLVSNIGEDINFTMQAVLLTDKVKIINYVGYNWYYNENSVSNTAHKNLENNLQFDYLINNIYDVLERKELLDSDYIEYFFIKLIIWFLLYASRGSDYKLVKKELFSNFEWLKERFPKFKKNKLVRINKPKGEYLKYRLIVYIFMKLYKLHLAKLFLLLYSKL